MKSDTFGTPAPFLKSGSRNGFAWLVDGIAACNTAFVCRLVDLFQQADSSHTPLDVVTSALQLACPEPGEFCHLVLAHVETNGDREVITWAARGDVRVIYGLGDHDKDLVHGELTEPRDSLLVAGLENIISKYNDQLKADFGKRFLQEQYFRGLSSDTRKEDLQFGRLVVHNPKTALFAFCSTAFTTSPDLLKASDVAELVYDLRRARSLSQFFKEAASIPVTDPFCHEKARLHRGFPFEILRLTGVSL